MRTLVLDQDTYAAEYGGGTSFSKMDKQGIIAKYVVNVHQMRADNAGSNYDLDSVSLRFYTLKEDNYIYSLVLQILEHKMEKAIPIFLYDFSYDINIIKKYVELCKKYGYELHIITHDDNYKNGIDKNRSVMKGLKYIADFYSPSAIFSIESKIRNMQYPRYAKLHRYEDISQLRLLDWLKTLGFDMSINVINNLSSCNSVEYDKIVAIGDIHGSYNALTKYFNEHPYNENYLYVFLGDYIDRGKNSGKVLNYLIDNFVDKPNVVMLEGNHERSLFLYGNNVESYSEEFENHTKQDLIDNGITRKIALDFYNKLKISYCAFDINTNTQFDFTHGCPPYSLTNYRFVHSGREIIRGVGKYDDVYTCEAFAISEFMPVNGTRRTDWASLATDCTTLIVEHYFTIHGHRNPRMVKDLFFRGYGAGVNLEGNVENGGELRVFEFNLERAAEPHKDLYVNRWDFYGYKEEDDV